MSSKHGPAQVPNENYPTMAWPVDRLLEAVDLPGGRWLEPCAGEGGIIKAINARRQDVQWTAVELRDCTNAIQCASVDQTGKTDPKTDKPPVIYSPQDFLEWALLVAAHPSDYETQPFDVAITNPPYSIAQAVINRCLRLARIVVMGPMRLAFLASDDRHPWWREIGIPDQYILPNRPDFTGVGGDSADYAWFVWDPHVCNVDRARFGRTFLLNLTPDDVRKAQRPTDWKERRAAAKKAKEERARAKAQKILGSAP